MASPTSGGFYDLDTADNYFDLQPGLLAGLPNGLRALDGNDTLQGSADAEKMNGNQGNDILSGGGGDDFLQGGKGTDSVVGDDGNDTLNGNLGQDFVFGADGNDTVRGGRDADILSGGEGNDVLIGDFGGDLLAGNTGNDVFVLRIDTVGPEEGDWILDFQKGSDRIGLTGGLTEAGLAFEQQNIPMNEALTRVPSEAANAGIVLPDITLTPALIRYALAFFTGADIDPNGDGIISGTSINIAATGQALGLAVNMTPSDLAGVFIPAEA